MFRNAREGLKAMWSDCPPAEILSAFLEHSLTLGEQEAVEHHLAECWTCRETLKEALSRDQPPDQEAK